MFAADCAELAGSLVPELAAGGRIITLSLEDPAESANKLEKAKTAIPLKDPDSVRRIQQALDDIVNGIRRYSRDGIPFQNREGILPDEPLGYYEEYTVQPPAGVTNRELNAWLAAKAVRFITRQIIMAVL